MPVALIRKLETFIGLSEAEKLELRRAFQRRSTIFPGEELFVQGEPAEGVIVIISGIGYRYKLTASGRRQIFHYLLPGDLLTPGALMGVVLDHSARVISAMVCSTAHALDVLSLHPNLMRSLWSLTARELSITAEWVANVGQRDARARLAHLFCELYYRMLEIGHVEDGSFSLPASQMELADSIGVTNVHLNRVLQTLRKDGVVAFESGTVTVPDIAALKKIGEFDADYLHLERSGALIPRTYRAFVT